MHILLTLIMPIVGCDAATDTGTAPPFASIQQSAETKLWITKPADKGEPFSPGETMECTGKFTIGRSHHALSIPKISILSAGNVQIDQVRAEQKEQEPNGEVPFEAKLRCPKRPGKYMLRATMVVTPDPKPQDNQGKLPREIVITAPLIHLEVKDQGR